jgi:hypothetical protein
LSAVEYAKHDARLAIDLIIHRVGKAFREQAVEVEDYLPSGSKDLKGIVEFISDPSWINRIEDVSARNELGEIASAVLGLESNEQTSLIAELTAGLVDFSAAFDANVPTQP